MRLRTLAAVLFAALLAWPAAAQEQRGSIEGFVRDTSGAVLPGVTVTLEGGSGVKIDTVSDSNGQYRFPSVQPGRYTVSANLQGFNPGKVSDIDVALGQIKKVDFSLAIAGVSETVQVTAEVPLVDVKQSARSTNIRAEQVALLPHDNNFTSLVTQAPGANNEPKSGGIMIDGASASENRYVVDGIETTELVHGTNGKNVLSDFVDEVQVKSSGYTAEYGGSTGGVINVITKSGTNDMNGSVGMAWQGSSVQGQPNQTLRTSPTNSSVAEYIRYPKDDYNRLQPGFAIGGPVLKNRAWYFGAYEPALTTTKRSVSPETAQTPTASTSSATQKQQVQYLTANQTAQIGDKLRTRIAFNDSWSKTKGLLPSLSGSDAVGTNYGKTSTYPNWTLSGTADYIVSPKFFVGFRAGYYNADQRDSNVPDVTRYLFTNSSTNIGMPGVPADLQEPVGYSNVLSNSAVIRDKRTRTYAQIDGTWYGNLAGQHQLKGGVQIDRRGEDILSGEQENLVRLSWDLSLPGGSPVERGTYGYYQVRSNAVDPQKGFVTQGDVSSNLVGLFIQDAWTVNNKLTLNLGVRTEQEKIPAFTTGADVPKYPIQFNFGDKIAPRLGAAYDVTGDGTWKVYGSWGVFYDIFKLELPQGSFGGQKWLEYYYTLDTPNWNTLDTASCPPACPGTLIKGPVDFRHPSFGSDAIEPNLKPMRSQEASAGIEHQLNNVMALSARYVHKQLDRGIEDTGSIDADNNEIYIIANPGEGLTTYAYPGVNLPKMKRDYDGVEIALEKRYADNWFFRGSYLWSRLYGNYPGLSQSDENGRTDPNVGRLYDYPLIMFKQDGTPSYGPLPTDRPNQVKLNAFYQFRFGTTVGANQYIMSGLPVTRELSVIPPNNFPVQYLGRGSDGRTDVYTQTDLFVQHSFNLGGGRAVQVEATVLNLFNQRNAISKFSTYNRGNGIKFDEGAFYAGQLNFDQLIQAQGIVKDARFLMNNDFQDPIQARFGVKFVF